MCFAEDKNGIQKPCNFSLYNRRHDGCVDGNLTQLQSIQDQYIQHVKKLDAEIFDAFFPNETNRLWCPIGEAKGEVGLCSPRCPVSNRFVGITDQRSHMTLCIKHMTFHYKNGEVTNGMEWNNKYEECGGAEVSGGEVFMDLD